VGIAWLASMSLERVDLGEMNIQLIANEENEDRAHSGKNEAGRMVPLVCRAQNHVANAATDDRSDDAEQSRRLYALRSCRSCPGRISLPS
jgi:hypothetical protein